MKNSNFSTLEKPIYQHLSEHLVLRSATANDADRIAAFNNFVHEDERVGRTIKKLLLGQRPRSKEMLYLYVEDTKFNRITSSMVLVSLHGSYAGIPIRVGCPEFVGTHPDYRGKGLIDAQFTQAHIWAEQQGQLMQIIAGIPYFYRQFGYEMTINMGFSNEGPITNIPALTAEEPSDFTFRSAEQKDIDFIIPLYQKRMEKIAVGTPLDESDWQYVLEQKDKDDVNGKKVVMIENRLSEPVGFFMHPALLEGDTIPAMALEIDEARANWQDVLFPVCNYLKSEGQGQIGAQLRNIGLELAPNHPIYPISQGILPEHSEGYAWYIRINDIPAFITRIQPILEDRLTNSELKNYTGTMRLSFYRNGTAVEFDKGKLISAAAWDPNGGEPASARFPAHTFLHVLLGHRSIDELRHIFPDCAASQEAKALIECLFPKQASYVLPII
jgi:GNAT superfamily N-acetyltransferase